MWEENFSDTNMEFKQNSEAMAPRGPGEKSMKNEESWKLRTFNREEKGYHRKISA